MIAAFILGALFGAGALMIVALHFSRQSKSVAEQRREISAIGMPTNGGAYVDPFYAKTLEPILRNVYGEKHTRH